MKKAQVTMFIMIGMILLVMSALFFYATELSQKRVGITVVEASDAKELVEHCLNAVADDALLVIGRHGGFARLPVTYFEPLNATYLFDDGQNNALDADAVAQQLADYTEQHLNACVNDFLILQDKGIMVVEKSPPKVTVTLAERDVRFAIDYAVEEQKGGMKTVPSFVPAQKAVRLKHTAQLAHDLVESEKNNNGQFDLDAPCELDVTHFPIDKTLITIITDNNFLIQNKPYRFVFAHKR